MAVKAKINPKQNCLRLSLMGCSVLIVMGYLLVKSYQLIVLRRQNQDDGSWWKLKVFTSDTEYAPSLTEIDFYWEIWKLIQIDVITVHNFLINLVPFTFESFINHVMWVCIFLLTVLLAGLGGYYYLLYIVRQRGNKNTEHDKRKSSDEKRSSKDEKRSSKDEKRSSKDEKRSRSSKEDVKSPKKTNKQTSMTDLERELLKGYNHKKYYWKLLTGILFFAFLMSIPWEFVRLYQSMVAEKVTQMTSGIPPECVPDQMSVTQSLKSWFRWQFSWMSDPCLKYHKALLVDPMWQVPPLMVISSAFSHCLVYPIEIFLGGIGRAFRNFFMEIPGPWQPIMLIVMVILLVLVLVMMFGYRIHLPLLIKFEPQTPLFVRLRSNKHIRTEADGEHLNFSLNSSTQESQHVGSSQESPGYSQNSIMESQGS